MNKKVFIITNPGENGAENFCEGVYVDLSNYMNYFESKLGGGWEKEEFVILDRPKRSTLLYALEKSKDCDYILFVFSGHGYFLYDSNSTVIELRKNEELNEHTIKKYGKRQSIILDCCREVYDRFGNKMIKNSLRINESVLKSFSADNISSFYMHRKYYEKSITECSNGVITLHSCSKDETSGDDEEFGGYYSSSLFDAAKKWYDDNKGRVEVGEYMVNSIVATHNYAKPLTKIKSGERQNPYIEKYRTTPYFPFSIIVKQ